MKVVFLAILLFFSFRGFCRQKSPQIETARLTDSIYVCTSYDLPGSKNAIPANGLYILTDAGIILIETPWTEDQTHQLINQLQNTYHKKITLCTSTHFHADRTACLDLLKKHGVKTFSSERTKQIGAQKGGTQSEFTFNNDTSFTVGNTSLQTSFPGEGHSKDNIVIWLPRDKVLFGGCLVKSLDASTIGNLEDATVSYWPHSIMHIKDKYRDIQYLVPGHQGWEGGGSMLQHTLDILQKVGVQ